MSVEKRKILLRETNLSEHSQVFQKPVFLIQKYWTMYKSCWKHEMIGFYMDSNPLPVA